MRLLKTAITPSLALALLAGIIAAAQSPLPAQPTFRTGIDIVQLDVSVLDAGRRPVRGLTAADFTVLEDGKPRPVVSLSAVEVPERAEASAPWMRDVAPDIVSNDNATHRLIVIVMDDVVPAGDPSVTRIGTRVAKAIVDELRPSDLTAVVFTFSGRNQNFTTDRSKLLAAIDSYTPMPAPLACGLKPSGSCSVDTMERIAGVLREAPAGRKMMLYVGVNPLPLDIDELDRAKYSTDLFRILQAANITVDTFDANGLQTFGAVASDRDRDGANARILTARTAFDDAYTLAYNTGGRTFTNVNDPWVRVPDVFRENSAYYLLGFESAARPNDRRLHKIQVRTNRPGVTIRTRSGYFGPVKEKPKKEADLAPIEAALLTTLPTGDIPLDLAVAPFEAPSGKGAELLVFTGVKETGAAASASRRIDLVARAYDKNGGSQGILRQTIEARAAQGMRYETVSRLPVKAGQRYDVRIAASGGDRRGSVFADVDVPDFAKDAVSMSGLVLAHGHARVPVDRRIADVITVVPITLRAFTPRDAVAAFVRIYRGDKGKAAPGRVVTTIVNERSQKVFERETPLDGAPSKGAGVDHRIDLPLQELGPGQYLLSIEASAGTAHARRDVRFSVYQ